MKTKKWFSLALVTSLLLTGCSKEKEQAKDADSVSGEITVLTNRTDGDDIFKEIEAKFLATYPEVSGIHYEHIADYDSTVMTRMNSGDYGDVLFIPFSMAGNRSEYPNFFEPLGTVNDLSKDFLDVREADFDNTVYGMPVALNSLGLIYNEDIFKEAGIDQLPVTIDELINDLQTIKKQTNAIPFYSNYQALAVWAGALTSFGGEQFKSNTLESGDAFAEGQPIRQVMDFFYTLASEGLIEPDPITYDSQLAFQSLADGKIAMLMNGSQEVAGIQSKSESPIAIMNFPVETDGKTSLPLGAPAVLGVNKHSNNKETAKAFVEFFNSEESGYAKELNGMPNKRSDLSTEQQSLINDSHVILTVATETPEVNERYGTLSDDVGISRLTDVLQQTINIGLYPDKNMSYQNYVEELSTKWKKAASSNE